MKPVLFSFLILVAGALFSQAPTNGLVGGWVFTGNAADISGNGNNGTPSGATLTADRFGNANCAYYFNGTSDYITMLNAGPQGSVSRSISFWAKTTNTISQVGFNYGGPGNGGVYQILFNYNCQGIGFDNSIAALIRGNTLADNTWHHIVAVLNSTVGVQIGNVDLYVDAVLQPNVSCFVTSTTSVINSNNVFPIIIGRSSNALNRFFKGDLDDFYFYDRPLSLSEIQMLYNDNPCGSAPLAPGSITGSTSICSGAPSIYSVAPVNGTSYYNWALPGGWTGASTTTTLSALPGSAGTISVCAVNLCGQSPYATLNITVLPTPSLAIAGNTAICKGGLANLTAFGAATYSWSTGSTAQGITVSPTVTTTYTVWGTSSAGCSATAIQPVTASGALTPSVIINGPASACAGSAISLGASGATTYTWQPGSLNGFFVAASLTATTVYTVTGTDANGCTGTAFYTQVVEVCTGIEPQAAEQAEIMLFPNPASTTVLLSCNGCNKVEIYTAFGACIYAAEITNREEKISLAGFNDGLYFIRVSGSAGSIVKTLVKQ